MGWHQLIKLCRFQVCNSMMRHQSIAVCAHTPSHLQEIRLHSYSLNTLAILWPWEHIYIHISVFILPLSLSLLIFFNFIYLFLERGEGREKKREWNINMWLPLMWPPLGTWPATQACAWTGNQTSNPLIRSPHLSLLFLMK